jgi:hypothetical protein
MARLRRRHHQPEVEGEADVVVEDVRGQRLAGDDRLDHSPHPRLTQAFDQRVEVGVPAQDELLLRRLDHASVDRGRAVRGQLLHRLPGERVDQPGLAARQLEGERPGLGGEGLAGVGGVLAVELGDLVRREVGKGERFDLDVERRGGAEAPDLRANLPPVIPHVAQAHQGHGLRELPGPVGVPRAELVEDRDQEVVEEGVDLVEEEHHRPRALPGPAGEKIEQAKPSGSRGIGGRGPELLGKVVLRRDAQGAEHRLDPLLDIASRGLPHLAGGEESGIAPLRGEGLGEGAEVGGLAGLPGRVDDEMLPVDQPPQLGQPALRRQHVVQLGPAGSGGIEEPRHRVFSLSLILGKTKHIDRELV